MTSVKQLNDVPLDTWETIANYWDKSIGKDGNIYWKKLQEPSLRRLLGDHLGKESCRALDLATGNGICARWLAKHGARVTATDGSENMVQIAKNWMKGEERSDSAVFTKLDVTQTEDFDAFIAATGENMFDIVLMNMAIMDVSTLEPLVQALPKLLKPNGVFVATLLHPVFMTSGASRNVDLRYDGETGDLEVVRTKVIKNYLHVPPYKGIAIPGQSKRQLYFHRPMNELFTTFFQAGLVMDAMEEPAFSEDDREEGRVESSRNYTQLPAILSFRMRMPYKNGA
ncbi:S-adenosyl-L-methionine-dependent methyltransferase [Neurospora intermedia]|uniref:S-adenosyl-L-methionine-dependent methyltransferase n=1 Tax=Neurospora intermedia TaxID=5142 RepID=A0ABR3D652_NEUIN